MRLKWSVTNSSGSKSTGSPGPNRPSLKFADNRQGVIIGDKDVQPPSTLRVGFQMVEEQAVTVGDQFPTKALTVGIHGSAVGAPCLCLCEPVRNRRGRRGAVVERWEPDSSEIGEQGGGEGGMDGHGDFLFSRGAQTSAQNI